MLSTLHRCVALLYQRVVRWGFARLYNEFAWMYDLVARLVSRGLWYRWTLAALPYLQGRVLELGCGTGYLQCRLAECGQVAFGLDASPQMLTRTRRRARSTGVALRLLRGRGQNLPLATGSCDTILATFPAEYILETATAREIVRVLAPNGRLVLVDAPAFHTDDLITRLIDLVYAIVLQTTVQQTPPQMLRFPTLEDAGLTFVGRRIAVDASSILVLVGMRREEASDDTDG